MQLVNLVPAFVDHVIKKRDRVAYDREFPNLFDHYYRYWSERRPFPPEIAGERVTRQANLFKEHLSVIESNFRRKQLPLESLTLVLFVGQGTTNGHAFTEHNKTIVWIPVETYDSDPATDVFISHEIAHGLHYQLSRQFEFNDTEERYQTGRQLITEGVATYFSQVTVELDDSVALWADYLSPEDASAWMKRCALSEKALARSVLKQFYATSVNTPYFVLTEHDQEAPSRSGYYLGLSLVKRLAASLGLSLEELLTIERCKFEELIRAELGKMAAQPDSGS